VVTDSDSELTDVDTDVDTDTDTDLDTDTSSPTYTFVQVAAGAGTSSGLTASGDVVAWDVYAPSTASARAPFSYVDNGSSQPCAISVAGGIECWPGGWPLADLAPVVGSFSLITTGYNFGCAIDASTRELVCWGDPPAHGKWGYALNYPEGTFLDVSVDQLYYPGTCAVQTDGELSCWGFPLWVDPPEGPFVEVEMFNSGFMARRPDGTLVSMNGEVDGLTPAPAGVYSQVSCAHHYCCGLSLKGEISCWGDETGIAGLTSPPARVYASVSAGYDHGCALTASGDAVCWPAGAPGTEVP
jgi:hypothetical protein